MLFSEMIETIPLKSEMTVVYSCLLHFSSLNLVSVVLLSPSSGPPLPAFQQALQSGLFELPACYLLSFLLYDLTYK